MTTITLPDNISFEEIARYWTHVQKYKHLVIGHYEDHYEFLISKWDYDDGFLDCICVADFYPNSRELNFFYEKEHATECSNQTCQAACEAVTDLLDFIKEKSNG